jgi:hypothetical protein
MERKLDMKNAEDKDLAFWYNERFLPKTVGVQGHFCPAIRHYTIISKVSAMNAKTEAFGVTVAIGNEAKWNACWKCKQEHGGFKQIIMPLKKDPTTGKEIPEETRVSQT